MTRSRAELIERRRDWNIQRQRHVKERSPDCGCAYCLADRGTLNETIKRLNLPPIDAAEIPF